MNAMTDEEIAVATVMRALHGPADSVTLVSIAHDIANVCRGADIPVAMPMTKALDTLENYEFLVGPHFVRLFRKRRAEHAVYVTIKGIDPPVVDMQVISPYEVAALLVVRMRLAQT